MWIHCFLSFSYLELMLLISSSSWNTTLSCSSKYSMNNLLCLCFTLTLEFFLWIQITRSVVFLPQHFEDTSSSSMINTCHFKHLLRLVLFFFLIFHLQLSIYEIVFLSFLGPNVFLESKNSWKFSRSLVRWLSKKRHLLCNPDDLGSIPEPK